MSVITTIVPGDTRSEGASVPLCPIAGCDTLLTQDDILRIIGRGFDERLHESPDFTPLIQGKTRKQLEAAAKALIFKTLMVTTDTMRCPFCESAEGSDFWFEDHGHPRIICPNPLVV